MWRDELKKREINPSEEIDLRSPASEWAALQETPVWQDLRDLLLQSLSRVRDDLESTGSSATPDISLANFAYLQGEASMLRLLLDLPEKMQEEQREEQTERKGPKNG